MNRPLTYTLTALALIVTAGALRADDPPPLAVPDEPLLSVVRRPHLTNHPSGPPMNVDGVIEPPGCPTAFPDAPHVCSWRVWASGGVYVLRPTFSTNPAFVFNRPIAGGVLADQVDFSPGMNAAPMIWAGIENSYGFGFRSRWFNYSADDSVSALPGAPVAPARPFAPTIGGINATSNLDISSVDLEATQSWQHGPWALLFGGGARYVHLNQEYLADLNALSGTRTLVSSGHVFNGAGPTLSLEGRRRLGQSGFGLYALSRGSLLFGTTRENYTTTNNLGAAQAFTRSQLDVLPIGELEAGAEYAHCIGHLRLFVQGGFIGQIWWNAGNSSNFDPLNDSSASSTNFGLLGFALRGGVTW